jgi:hypothetical protein
MVHQILNLDERVDQLFLADSAAIMLVDQTEHVSEVLVVLFLEDLSLVLNDLYGRK